MPELQNVAVLGGTGRFGRAIVGALAEADFNVSIVTRNASNVSDSAKFKTVQSDYSYDSLVNAFAGHDAVISAVSVGPAIIAQKTMIDAAVVAGVKRFVPSEYGSSSIENPLEDFRKLMKPKTDIIEYLRKTGSENPSFTWSCVSTGACIDEGFETGLWGFSISDQTATIGDSGKARFDSSTRDLIAQSVVSILRDPESTANQYLYVRSFVLTPRDLLAALENATGVKWTVNRRDSEETRQRGWKLIQDGKPHEGIPKVVQGSLFNDKTDFVVPEDQLSNKVLNLPETDLEEYVKRLVARV